MPRSLSNPDDKVLHHKQAWLVLIAGLVTTQWSAYLIGSAHVEPSPFVLTVGLMASIILLMVVRFLLNTRNRAVTINRQITKSLRASETMHRSILKSALDAVIIADADERITGWNRQAVALLGWSEHEAIGEPLWKMLMPRQYELARAKGQQLYRGRHGDRPVLERRFEVVAHRRDGRAFSAELSISRAEYDGHVAYCVFLRDITERKRWEKQLREAALHDMLTNLPNRLLFMDRLGQAIARAKRQPEYRFAVLYLDFDRFKIINDSLGHGIGDDLLVAIAKRLGENLRDTDAVGPPREPAPHLAARLGGDEFVVLLDGIRGLNDVSVVADRLQDALAQPYRCGGHSITATASIGIVISDGQYDRPQDILRDADIAMYDAKNTGKARHVVFDDTMREDVVFRLSMEEELRRAVRTNEFVLHYQPILDLAGRSAIGFEALIRWPTVHRGMVAPDMFIGLAEELGLIVPIGSWAAAQACRTLRRWHGMTPTGASLGMNINLSKRQLSHPDLVKSMARIIRETGVDPTSLRLEVTESEIMDHRNMFVRVLSELRDLGPLICMDDFGTGHSSLSCLHEFPIDVLKIDRRFVADMAKSPQQAAVVRTIIDLAHTLEMRVVGEGIETAEQADRLTELGCDFGQGYYFAHPMSEAQVETYFEQSLSRAKSA